MLDSAQMRYVPTAGGFSRVVRLSAQDVAALWGAATVAAGATRRATVAFRHLSVLTVQTTVAYHPQGGAADSASATVACVAPLVGTYVLRAINGRVLPAKGGLGVVYGDTLTFAPDLTYSGRGRWEASAVYGSALANVRYDVLGPDSLYLPAFLPGYGFPREAVTLRRGPSLVVTAPACCGASDDTFR